MVFEGHIVCTTKFSVTKLVIDIYVAVSCNFYFDPCTNHLHKDFSIKSETSGDDRLNFKL